MLPVEGYAEAFASLSLHVTFCNLTDRARHCYLLRPDRTAQYSETTRYVFDATV